MTVRILLYIIILTTTSMYKAEACFLIIIWTFKFIVFACVHACVVYICHSNLQCSTPSKYFCNCSFANNFSETIYRYICIRTASLSRASV